MKAVASNIRQQRDNEDHRLWDDDEVFNHINSKGEPIQIDDHSDSHRLGRLLQEPILTSSPLTIPSPAALPPQSTLPGRITFAASTAASRAKANASLKEAKYQAKVEKAAKAAQRAQLQLQKAQTAYESLAAKVESAKMGVDTPTPTPTSGKKRGRPYGSKDKAPRNMKARIDEIDKVNEVD